MFIYRCINSMVPPIVENIIEINEDNKRQLSASNYLKYLRGQSSFYNNTIAYYAGVKWSSFPTELKKAASLHQFKSRLKKYLSQLEPFFFSFFSPFFSCHFLVLLCRFIYEFHCN